MIDYLNSAGLLYACGTLRIQRSTTYVDLPRVAYFQSILSEKACDSQWRK